MFLTAPAPYLAFVSFAGDLQDITIRLSQNGVLQQRGNSAQMITPIPELLAYASKHFTLLPGDIVLTGTPAGVGPLYVGDQLVAELDGLLKIDTVVK